MGHGTSQINENIELLTCPKIHPKIHLLQNTQKLLGVSMGWLGFIL